MNQSMCDCLIFFTKIFLRFSGRTSIRHFSGTFWTVKGEFSIEVEIFDIYRVNLTILYDEFVAAPNIAIGYANPRAETIETMVNTLFGIGDLITYIKTAFDNNAWTWASRTQKSFFAWFVFSTFFALKQKYNRQFPPSVHRVLNDVPLLWRCLVESDSVDDRHVALPTENVCPSFCTVASDGAVSEDHLVSRRNRPVAWRYWVVLLRERDPPGIRRQPWLSRLLCRNDDNGPRSISSLKTEYWEMSKMWISKRTWWSMMTSASL